MPDRERRHSRPTLDESPDSPPPHKRVRDLRPTSLNTDAAEAEAVWLALESIETRIIDERLARKEFERAIVKHVDGHHVDLKDAINLLNTTMLTHQASTNQQIASLALRLGAGVGGGAALAGSAIAAAPYAASALQWLASLLH